MTSSHGNDEITQSADEKFKQEAAAIFGRAPFVPDAIVASVDFWGFHEDGRTFALTVITANGDTHRTSHARRTAISRAS